MYPETKNTILVPFTEDYAPTLYSWYTDPVYSDFFRQNTRLLTPFDFKNYPQLIGGTILLALEKNSLNPIALINLIADSKKNNGFYLALLVEKNYQSKRFPTEVVSCALDYGFKSLNYQKCIVEVLEKNIGLNKTLAATGWHLEGKLLQECYINGEFVNENRWVMLRSGWNSEKILGEKYKWDNCLK